MKLGYLIALNVLAFGACTNKPAENANNSIPSETTRAYLPKNIEAIDDRFNQIIHPDAKLEILAEGHDWTEGPLWIESEQMLLYSDIPKNAIYSWKENSGSSLWLENAGGIENREGSNGLLLNKDGQLVLCQHGSRQMGIMNAAISNPIAEFTPIASTYDGKKLNSPNDAVFASDGSLYFTDPPYGLASDEEQELPFQGIYRLDTDGTLTLLNNEFSRPNGIALSPDERTLIVANSDPKQATWHKFDITKKGALINKTLLFDATDWQKETMPGLPDGLKVSSTGHLFATGPGGLYVFSPEHELLGIVHTGRATSNCALDSQEKFLYLTADDLLVRIAITI